MFKVFILLAICGYSSAVLLGGAKCTWGPSYWCHKINNTKECSAFDHCKERVWPSADVPSIDRSVLCKKCDDLLDYMKQSRQNGISKHEIMTELERKCREENNGPPDSTKCEKVLRENYDSIAAMLDVNIHDRVICAIQDLCRYDEEFAVKQVIGGVHDVRRKRMVIPDTVNRDPCSDCINFFDDVKDMVSGEIVQQIVSDKMESLCEKCPVKDQCREWIRTGVSDLFDAVRNDLDTQTICSTIKMCPVTSTNIEINTTKANPPTLLRIPLGFNPIPNELRISPLPIQGKTDNPECMLCEWLISTLDRELKNNYTEAAIQEGLDKVCNLFPSRYSSKCQRYVEKYSAEIITTLAMTMNPELVCSSIGSCMLAVLDMPTCDQCQNYAKYMLASLDSPDTQRAVKNLLSSFCRYVPGAHLEQDCETVVESAVPIMLEELVKKLTPEQVCQMLRMCG